MRLIKTALWIFGECLLIGSTVVAVQMNSSAMGIIGFFAIVFFIAMGEAITDIWC